FIGWLICKLGWARFATGGHTLAYEEGERAISEGRSYVARKAKAGCDSVSRANDAGALVRWHQITHNLIDWNESTHVGAGQEWLDLGDLVLWYEDRVPGVH